VGRLLDVLEERGLRDDTVVVFTSDHGENAGDFGIWDKRFFYEMSCGVPLVMAGPGMAGQERLNGPRLSRALVNHLDLYPTLLALAGAEPEADHRRWGRSLLPVLAGAPGAGRDALFAELATAAMVRTGQWKLVFDPEQGGVRQLFNLARDPDELNNLAGVAGYEPVAASLVERLLSHRIRLTQFTHAKEEQRLQRVRIT